MALSRWTDEKNTSIESVLSNMMNFKNWHEVEKDPLTNEELHFNIEKAFEENRTIVLNDVEIEYNLINYEYERVRPGASREESRSVRIMPMKGFVLIYSDRNRVQYITNRAGNKHTLTILRKLNNYTGKLEIQEAPFQITEDLFTWMIFRVMKNVNNSLDDESHLLINKVTGFKGSSRDRLAEITGTGNRILNQLSTLAFLFENKRVFFIKVNIEYKNDKIEFSIDLNGNVDIEFDTYIGDHSLLKIEEEIKSSVILMVFLEIIPKILTCYHMDKENKDWSEKIKVDFFSDMGKSITEQITKKIEENDL